MTEKSPRSAHSPPHDPVDTAANMDALGGTPSNDPNSDGEHDALGDAKVDPDGVLQG
ncbi:hypothetical protein SYNPS1DRAFT_21722, partial [Syncephalis pseudoplumigaleata]